MPPKAVASMRFVTQKNVHEYITKENMLTCWGGEDDYEFKFIPEKTVHENGASANADASQQTILTVDENDNTTIVSHEKKVCHFVLCRACNSCWTKIHIISSFLRNMFSKIRSFTQIKGTFEKLLQYPDKFQYIYKFATQFQRANSTIKRLAHIH